jgi:pimeloyl-ACP methyl ester carboxylesterase
MGAPVALLYGARNPDHPAALVALSGFVRWDHQRLVEAFRRSVGDEVAELADRVYAGREVSDEEWARVFAAFGPHVPDEHTLARRVTHWELNEHGRAVLGRVDLVASLSSVRAPAVVVVGTRDPVTPVAASEEIVAALPVHAQLAVLEGAGHFPWLDEPVRLRAVLSELIGRVA